MQLLAMIASFVFGRLNNGGPRSGGIRETVMEMFEDIVLKGRKPVILILAGVCAVLFFCGGLFITILEGTTQYDRVGYVTLTSTLGAGIALFLVAALGFVYVFAYAWPGADRHASDRAREKVPPPHHASTLEQALTVLVLDFVKERELRRDREAHGPTPHATTGPAPTTPREHSGPIH
ncbi:hypothetical protein AZI86_12125 [Bdellovibrio bacteriovorus]|uniref:Transmembrane protein n=1 Tax=Bdellovibrio bacteriovorus TaxID=959 RepID=A0A150WLY2_BDEBC|nr:hypothetical protein [Bdellovibrio bacteriovorus]KYG64938.1 hypothetical protein AZI86_12125 [Bdellovibrio bacteriovorus]